MKKFTKNNLINSLNAIMQTIYNHVLHYPSPINFNYAYSAGSVVGIFFAVQNYVFMGMDGNNLY